MSKSVPINFVIILKTMNSQKYLTGRGDLSATQTIEYCVCGSHTIDTLQIN
jgi:hypothetical protein